MNPYFFLAWYRVASAVDKIGILGYQHNAYLDRTLRLGVKFRGHQNPVEMEVGHWGSKKNQINLRDEEGVSKIPSRREKKTDN